MPACNADEQIKSHVDLRAHGDSSITHRALLGMGVGLTWRRQNLATQLLEYAGQWVLATPPLEWIDIEVLAANAPAITLYKKAGFVQIAEIPDLYRIDSTPETVIGMAMKIRAD